jgi:hypothetical protein
MITAQGNTFVRMGGATRPARSENAKPSLGFRMMHAKSGRGRARGIANSDGVAVPRATSRRRYRASRQPSRIDCRFERDCCGCRGRSGRMGGASVGCCGRQDSVGQPQGLRSTDGWAAGYGPALRESNSPEPHGPFPPRCRWNRRDVMPIACERCSYGSSNSSVSSFDCNSVRSSRSTATNR